MSDFGIVKHAVSQVILACNTTTGRRQDEVSDIGISH